MKIDLYSIMIFLVSVCGIAEVEKALATAKRNIR